MNRYKNTKKAVNSSDQYEEIFEDRNLKQITQYRTKRLYYPSDDEISTLDLIKYQWRDEDTYYKLASRFYGDYTYWWVIAQFNKKPFEGDLNIGDYILIPRPLNRVLQYMV